jgi:hypothetical protein
MSEPPEEPFIRLRNIRKVYRSKERSFWQFPMSPWT